MTGLPCRIIRNPSVCWQNHMRAMPIVFMWSLLTLRNPPEKGIFKVELFLPEKYPMAAPKVHSMTQNYHPNVDKLGRMCLDILKDKWPPALQIHTVLLSLQAVLSTPNPDDPLVNDVGEQWKTKEAQAIKT
ncbi:unnamed protein product, partial [Rangifer tarandus platyrhynchus]